MLIDLMDVAVERVVAVSNSLGVELVSHEVASESAGALGLAPR